MKTIETVSTTFTYSDGTTDIVPVFPIVTVTPEAIDVPLDTPVELHEETPAVPEVAPTA